MLKKALRRLVPRRVLSAVRGMAAHARSLFTGEHVEYMPPGHFYSPTANLRDVIRRRDIVFAEPTIFPAGIDPASRSS